MKFLVKYSDDGRVTIPREVRLALELQGRQDLELSVKDQQIIIEKATHKCVICGSEQVNECVVNKHTTYLCNDCLKELPKEWRV